MLERISNEEQFRCFRESGATLIQIKGPICQEGYHSIQSVTREEASVFNSPTVYCPRCRVYIALDERRRDCAAVHRCGNGCPMDRYFGAAKITGRRSGDEAQSGNERVAGDSAAREGSAG